MNKKPNQNFVHLAGILKDVEKRKFFRRNYEQSVENQCTDIPQCTQFKPTFFTLLRFVIAFLWIISWCCQIQQTIFFLSKVFIILQAPKLSRAREMVIFAQHPTDHSVGIDTMPSLQLVLPAFCYNDCCFFCFILILLSVMLVFQSFKCPLHVYLLQGICS